MQVAVLVKDGDGMAFTDIENKGSFTYSDRDCDIAIAKWVSKPF